MLLELKNITKTFETEEGEPLTVLSDLSLAVKEGETLGITGPSGSGKSTLLNIMGALDKPTSGSVLFAGSDLTAAADGDLAKIRNREIGFVFQLHHLLPQCTVLENVLIPAIPLRKEIDEKAVTERAEQLLERVGLKDRLHYFPGKLSGGERQRVAVVRALINNPKLILADEPTGSLDQASSDTLGELLLELNRDEGTTLILVTHSLDLAKRMGRVSKLRAGRLE